MRKLLLEHFTRRNHMKNPLTYDKNIEIYKRLKLIEYFKPRESSKSFYRS